MNRTISRIYFLLAAFVIFACAEKSDPTFEEENFTSIFDNNQFSAGFYPIDLLQTTDGGYLVLAEKNIPESTIRSAYVVKTDKYGKFVSEIDLGQNFVNPIAPLMVVGSDYYFFCMDPFSQQAKLIAVDEDGAGFTENETGRTYPAAATFDQGGFLLLSYDQAEKNTIVSKHNTDGDESSAPVAFSIGLGENVEEPVINHYLRTAKKFPFQIGKTSNGYFFNGFYNYTFSLVFLSSSLTNIQGVVQGQQDDGGFSSVLNISGGKFAASRFNFGENYFLPNVALAGAGTSAAVDLGGNSLPELTSNASVRIVSVPVKNENVLIFASDTKSKQIGLYFYDETSGEFISSRYLGFSNPFEVSSVSATADGGVIVSGTTYLAGRFPRICLLKLSKAELEKQNP